MKDIIYGATTTTPIPMGGGTADLTDYVKKTDYATKDKAGVIKVTNNDFGLTVESDGALKTSYASKANLRDKTSPHKPVTPYVLDYAVKVGLTTNTETLTDEEKVSAYNWLGINALAIPNVISGGEKSLTVNDVSPLAHKCSLRLVSDTYEEIVGESRNILEINEDVSFESFGGSQYETMNTNYDGNGVITFDGVLPAYSNLFAKFNVYLIPGKTYTFSARTENKKCGFNVTALTDTGIPTETFDISEKYTFTVEEGLTRFYIQILLCDTMESDKDATFETSKIYLQLELGDTMTDWGAFGGAVVVTKPYIEDFSTVKVNVGGKSYTPSTDGTVTGIISISPTMEITTDNQYANIHDFTYCVDTKKYIDGKFEELRAELQGVT